MPSIGSYEAGLLMISHVSGCCLLASAQRIEINLSPPTRCQLSAAEIRSQVRCEVGAAIARNCSALSRRDPYSNYRNGMWLPVETVIG
jgi:hypothetical protein